MGVVSFTRQSLGGNDLPSWRSLSAPIPKMHVDSRGYIEDCLGLLQVDFANK